MLGKRKWMIHSQIKKTKYQNFFRSSLELTEGFCFAIMIDSVARRIILVFGIVENIKRLATSKNGLDANLRHVLA